MRVTFKVETSPRPVVPFAATLLTPAAVIFNAIAGTRETRVRDVDADQAHLNLVVNEERCGMLADAERETLASLRLNRKQPQARNLPGVIYAQKQNTFRASLVWRERAREVPDYELARTSLALLDSQSEVVLGDAAAVALFFPAAAVKAIKSADKHPLEGIKMRRSSGTARQDGGELWAR